MSFWSIVINLVFIFGMFLMHRSGKKMEIMGDQPTRLDYFVALLYCTSGIFSFATCMNSMNTDPVRGWTDAVVGLAAMSVSIWALTLYKRLKASY